MKKNKFIIFISYLMVSFCAINIANAQWTLPNPATFNLSTRNPQTIIEELTKWLLGLVVAIGILAIIWAGISYVSSGGDTEQATTAKRIIKYALLGIIVAGVAWALVDVLVGTILS
ncbi:MAG: pilin [Patescibacteria group bacterium]|nr:pilin [Patescibacteria group bacterium]